MMRVRSLPSSSSSWRTHCACATRSPESRRTAPSLSPASSTAVRTAASTSYVSTSSAVPGAHRGDLRLEGLALGVVQQGEGMRGRAHGLEPVAQAGLQVRGAVEAGDDGGAGGGDGGFLLRAARAHLDAGAAAGRGDHAGGRRGDGAVVVEDREDVGLEDAGLGEGGFDDQDGGVREVRFALRVAPDVAGEGEPGQVVQGLLVDHLGAAEEIDFGVAEAEVRDALQQPAGAAHNAVAAPVRQPPGEGLEH